MSENVRRPSYSTRGSNVKGVKRWSIWRTVAVTSSSGGGSSESHSCSWGGNLYTFLHILDLELIQTRSHELLLQFEPACTFLFCIFQQHLCCGSLTRAREFAAVSKRIRNNLGERISDLISLGEFWEKELGFSEWQEPDASDLTVSQILLEFSAIQLHNRNGGGGFTSVYSLNILNISWRRNGLETEVIKRMR